MGEYYERALALADGDPAILDDVHDILMESKITEKSYAKVFALLFYKSRDEESRITYSELEKYWREGKKTLSDVKLFGTLNQCCDLIRYYALSSWESCVFSAWLPAKEVQKTEKAMDTMESMDHAKAILEMAASLMINNECNTQIDWSEGEEGEDDGL